MRLREVHELANQPMISARDLQEQVQGKSHMRRLKKWYGGTTDEETLQGWADAINRNTARMEVWKMFGSSRAKKAFKVYGPMLELTSMAATIPLQVDGVRYAGQASVNIYKAFFSAKPRSSPSSVGTFGEVEAAITSLQKRGIYPMEGQRPIDPAHILKLAREMQSGRWNPVRNLKSPPGYIQYKDGTKMMIGGHHRQIAEEIVQRRGVNFILGKDVTKVNSWPQRGDWTKVQRIPGVINER